MKKCTIKDCNDWAKKNGGVCLSNSYFNIKEKLSWRCVRGHEFKMAFRKVKEGQWCKECSIIDKRLNIEDILKKNTQRRDSFIKKIS